MNKGNKLARLDDELFDEAVKIVIANGKASASLLQRKLKIGYARSAMLLDLMETAGVVGPFYAIEPREVLERPNSTKVLGSAKL